MIKNTNRNDDYDNQPQKEMSFFDHLEELRWHLFRSALVLLIFTVGAFLIKKFLFDVVILSPRGPDFLTNRLLCQLGDYLNKSILCINQNELHIININVAGQFLTHMRISLIAGAIAAFPYIITELWIFIKPALYHNERKVAFHTVLFVSLLFFVGVVTGYYLVVPLSLNFLANYSISSDVYNTISLNSYISYISSICFASGLLFELPVLSYFLTRFGLLTPQFMKSYRRHAYIVILIVSAIITPPDIFSQVLIALPLFLLYEISINLSSSVMKKIKIPDND